jgi:hypothetical protein
MHARRSFIFGAAAAGLVAALAVLGGSSESSEMSRPGGVDVLVRSSVDTRRAGWLTLDSQDGERWRLPLHSATWQTRRLTLPAGRYTLAHEADVTGEPSALTPSPSMVGTLPRWIVVAAGRVTPIVVQLEADAPATRVAVTASSGATSEPLN